MSNATATGDGLQPVTRAEAVALSNGLQRHLERNPRAAEDPTLLAIARLLISLPVDAPNDSRLQRELEQDVMEIAARKIQRLLAEVNDLGSRNMSLAQAKVEADRTAESTRVELVATRGLLAQAQANLEVVTDDKRELEGLRQALAEAGKALEESQKKVLQVTAERTASQTKLRTQTDSHTKTKEWLTTLRTRVKDVLEKLTAAEWSGFHASFTAKERNSRGHIVQVKAKACPVCGGLSTEYNHKESGHMGGCVLHASINTLRKK